MERLTVRLLVVMSSDLHCIPTCRTYVRLYPCPSVRLSVCTSIVKPSVKQSSRLSVPLYLCMSFLYVSLFTDLHVLLYACLPVCLPARISICLFIRMPVCLYSWFLHGYPPACVQIYAYLFKCLYVRFRVCITVCRSVCSTVRLSTSLYTRVSAFPSRCCGSVFPSAYQSVRFALYTRARLLARTSVCMCVHLSACPVSLTYTIVWCEMLMMVFTSALWFIQYLRPWWRFSKSKTQNFHR